MFEPKRTVIILAALLCAVGCKHGSSSASSETASSEPPPPLKAEHGVDDEAKTIHIGAFNDVSGPGAAIGTPFAVGKRLVARRANSGELLPNGWTVELHEVDTAYNPSKTVHAYDTISDDVLFIGTILGLRPTLAVRKWLERDRMVAFPHGLSTQYTDHELTPLIFPTYADEARRAMDYAVESADSPETLKAAVVYHTNEYGEDVLDGWRTAAEKHDVDIVAETAVPLTQRDMSPVIASLEESGANVVMLGTFPNATGILLATAAQDNYEPRWIGATPSWSDIFFRSDSPAPYQIFANFHWATGLPAWGEDVPGMDTFLETYREHAANDHDRDFYILASYVQGLAQAEILSRCLSARDCTRQGFIEAMQTIEAFDAGGMLPPVDLSEVPYPGSRKIRVLQPDFLRKRWSVVGDWSEPS